MYVLLKVITTLSFLWFKNDTYLIDVQSLVDFCEFLHCTKLHKMYMASQIESQLAYHVKVNTAIKHPTLLSLEFLNFCEIGATAC